MAEAPQGQEGRESRETVREPAPEAPSSFSGLHPFRWGDPTEAKQTGPTLAAHAGESSSRGVVPGGSSLVSVR